MDKMQIYNAVRSVPQEAQKPFTNGRFRGTDIQPMWRIKTLTEQFGAAGIGWYTEVLNKEVREVDGELLVFVDINLYIKVDGEWSKPIFGTGGNKLLSKTKSGNMVSDEGYKMALTDAMSVACKALGIGADVYWGADKTSKYSQYYDDAGTPDDAADLTTKRKADMTCDRCGKAITGAVGKTGDLLTAEQVVTLSEKFFGGAHYCPDCQKELKGKRA